MGSYALIKDGKVLNMIAWAGEPPMDFGEGVSAIPIPDGVPIGIGYSYEDGKFYPPPLTPEQIQEQKEQQRKSNILEKDSRLSEATQKITIWQTKLLMGRKLTTAEMAALNQWMDYIDEITAIEADTSDEIEWPVRPA